MTTELPINSIDYPDIRDNFIKFLQEQVGSDGMPVYQDYNFQASGISTVLNLLAYNTHYIGYYVKMMLNEAFIDSAVKKESLFSKDKLTGYVPRGYTSSRADIQLQIDIDQNDIEQYEPSSRSILIPKGTSFNGQNNFLDQRIFFTIDDTFITNVDYSTPGIARYTSETITIYEGRWQEWKFRIDSTLLNQRYVIKDKFVDVETIRVLVMPDGSYEGETYFLATNVFDVDETSPVYYISTQEEGYYEVIFSNGMFGKAPPNNAVVYVNYISTKGETGNGCKKFNFNAPSQDIPTEVNIGNWEDFVVLTEEGTVSSGGVDPESVESMRFAIPNHYRRQNRIVTSEDYKSIILNQFRNIDSINVWGGEQNIYKDYGKMYISIKPKTADRLTLTAKKDIENRLLNKYCVVGMQPVFIDPEFIDTAVTLYAKIDTKKTNKTFGQIEKEIVSAITQYNDTYLNVFDNFLSDVAMLDTVMATNPSIKSCYSKKMLSKEQSIIYLSGIETVMLIGNPIRGPGVYSSTFTYGGTKCYFKDDVDGNLYIYNYLTGAKFLLKSFGWVNYEQGVIYYTFPQYAHLDENDFETYGIIKFTMEPINPDIETYLQNIVRITQIRVNLTNA